MEKDNRKIGLILICIELLGIFLLYYTSIDPYYSNEAKRWIVLFSTIIIQYGSITTDMQYTIGITIWMLLGLLPMIYATIHKTSYRILIGLIAWSPIAFQLFFCMLC